MSELPTETASGLPGGMPREVGVADRETACVALEIVCRCAVGVANRETACVALEIVCPCAVGIANGETACVALEAVPCVDVGVGDRVSVWRRRPCVGVASEFSIGRLCDVGVASRERPSV